MFINLGPQWTKKIAKKQWDREKKKRENEYKKNNEKYKNEKQLIILKCNLHLVAKLNKSKEKNETYLLLFVCKSLASLLAVSTWNE